MYTAMSLPLGRKLRSKFWVGRFYDDLVHWGPSELGVMLNFCGGNTWDMEQQRKWLNACAQKFSLDLVWREL